MPSITVKRADDLPYGLGQSDYEYDVARQRKLDEAEEARYCVNCRHYYKREFAPEVCMNPIYTRGINPVSGERRPSYCDTLREENGKCGPKGIGFEPKVPE